MGNIHVKLYEIWTSGSNVVSTFLLELWQHLCSVDWNHLCKFGRRHHEQSCEIILNFDRWFRKKMLFKGISYLELWQPFCSAERNNLCNFGRGYYEEQFCELTLNLGKWFRCLRFLIWSSGGPPVRSSRTIYAILK